MPAPFSPLQHGHRLPWIDDTISSLCPFSFVKIYAKLIPQTGTVIRTLVYTHTVYSTDRF